MTHRIIATIENEPIKEDVNGLVSFRAGARICVDGSGPHYDDPAAQDGTALYFDGKPLNADVDKYVVVPPQIRMGVKPVVMGCQAMVFHMINGRTSQAVVGDIGPKDRLGEISRALAFALGINPNPVSGGEDSHIIQYLLTPGRTAMVGGKQYRLQPAVIPAKKSAPVVVAHTVTAAGSGSTGRAITISGRSQRNIASLAPEVQPLAVQFLQLAAASGIHAEIISGTRTYMEQDAIYEQGRSLPGAIVTNARGGYSNHNFGLAFDVGLFDERGRYLAESSLYRQVAAIGKNLGLSWGGDWGVADEPHYELTPKWAKGMSEREMVARLREQRAETETMAV